MPIPSRPAGFLNLLVYELGVDLVVALLAVEVSGPCLLAHERDAAGVVVA